MSAHRNQRRPDEDGAFERGLAAVSRLLKDLMDSSDGSLWNYALLIVLIGIATIWGIQEGANVVPILAFGLTLSTMVFILALTHKWRDR